MRERKRSKKLSINYVRSDLRRIHNISTIKVSKFLHNFFFLAPGNYSLVWVGELCIVLSTSPLNS